MKVAFAGTPPFAATILRGLLASEHEVGLIVSQPDRGRGRGRKTTPTPVSALARSENLPLAQPARIGEVAPEISSHDALVVAAFGQILRPDTLYAAPHGAWNVHASLLPRHRGAAPIERAVMAGERETGITIMRMDEGLDTGPTALQSPAPIHPDTTGGELTDLLAQIGANAIVEALTLLEQGRLTLSDQDSLNATYAPKLLEEDKTVRWGEGVRAVHDLVRALSPGIGARAFHPGFDGPVKIWRTRVEDGFASGGSPGTVSASNGRIFVQCGVGVLEVLELQAPGGRRMTAREFLLGRGLEGAFVG
ncbi:MAG: methionyl-tRNA formyltransferase [Actinomycetota bacterium]|nr:methionyl-tRNA formyltransferase [Actinomycetota bacterium]